MPADGKQTLKETNKSAGACEPKAAANDGLADMHQIDAVCDRFVAAWKQGRPRIEDYLGDCQGPQRAAFLRELLAIEVHYRTQRGEAPAPADYLARLPEHAELIEELLGADVLARGPAMAAPLRPAARAGQGSSGRQTVLGNYLVLDKLGQGGMGQVFKARHRRMDRLVALKVLPPSLMQNPEAVRRFQREVKAAALLSHPNIVTAYDADEHQGVHFLVMEYVDGTDLATLIKLHGPLTPDQAVECVAQAARGLGFAHSRGVVHRDIKPANLLLDGAGTVKVLDMGLARFDEKSPASSAAAEQSALTCVGMVMGTVDYMSPEQTLDARHADPRSDIYSLGCTLFYLLTGRPMFSGETTMQRLVAHREQPIPSLRAAAKGVSEQLEGVFERMVAKRPSDRYPSMRECQEDLESCLSEGVRAQIANQLRDPQLQTFLDQVSEQTTRTTHGASTAMGGRRERRDPWRLPLVVAAGLGILLAAGSVWLVLHRGDETAGIDREVTPSQAATTTENGDEEPDDRELPNAKTSPPSEQPPRNAEDLLDRAVSQLYRGDSSLAALQVKFAADPARRTDFIHRLKNYPVDAAALATALQTSSDPALRSALCLAVALIPSVSLEETERQTLIAAAKDLYRDAPDGGTHSAAACVLLRWGVELPALETSQHANPPRRWFVNGQGMTMLVVPAGQFAMGLTPDITRRVTLTQPFCICNREATAAEFQKFLDDKDFPAAEKPPQEAFPPTSAAPAGPVTANWFDAVLFCNWLSSREGLPPCYVRTGRRQAGRDYFGQETGEEWDVWSCNFQASGYRLPTDAELEYACRAGTTSQWSFGDDESRLVDYGCYALNLAVRPTAVATKLPNAWGLFDVHGNVGEWCWDWYDIHSREPVTDPTGPLGGPVGSISAFGRSLRGGASNLAAVDCRSGSVGAGEVSKRSEAGFRVVCGARP